MTETIEAAAPQRAGEVPPATRVALVELSGGVPLGVIGFGFCILMFGVLNTGAVNGAALGWFTYVAIYTGALLMGFGGIWEAHSSNVFGATFSMAYAGFLLTTGVIVQFAQPHIVASAGQDAFNHGFAAWLFLWTVLTLLLFIGSLYVNVPAMFAFGLLAVVYFAAGIANVTSGDVSLAFTRIAGWFALADGIAAWYLAVGILLNGMSHKNMFPMGPHLGS